MIARLLASGAVASLLSVPSTVARQDEPSLTNADVASFLEAELRTAEIVSTIEARAVDFDTSLEALAPLVRSGTAPEVLEAMARAAAFAGRGREWALPSPGRTFRDALRSGGSGPEMVVVPAGSFRMGCVSGVECADWELPVHQVTVSAVVAVGKYEVTFAEWDACVSAGGCGHRPEDAGWGRGRRPVINVSWDDAQSYVRWLSSETGASYRLPSESEWEYAARAGSGTAYGWGDEIGSGRANCFGCDGAVPAERIVEAWRDWQARGFEGGQTMPVGSFGANAYGLHDMHGNVWEWVEDCWNESYSGAPSSGSAWTSGVCSLRVVRGGSWNIFPTALRSANRYRLTSGDRNYFIGFRVARTLTP